MPGNVHEPYIAAVADALYEAGVPVGDYDADDGSPLTGEILIVPPGDSADDAGEAMTASWDEEHGWRLGPPGRPGALYLMHAALPSPGDVARAVASALAGNPRHASAVRVRHRGPGADDGFTDLLAAYGSPEPTAPGPGTGSPAAVRYRWNDHSNDMGDWCPHSLAPAPASAADNDAACCPARCRDSSAEEAPPEPGRGPSLAGYAQDLRKSIRALGKAAAGDSNDAEIDAGHDVASDAEALLDAWEATGGPGSADSRPAAARPAWVPRPPGPAARPRRRTAPAPSPGSPAPGTRM